MAKHKKKKKSAKPDAIPNDLFSTAALSVKGFRQVTNEIAKLSTGQKLAGGLALVAAGVLYLERHRIGRVVEAATPTRADWARLLPAGLTETTEETVDEVPEATSPRKSRKPAKPDKHRPAAGPAGAG